MKIKIMCLGFVFAFSVGNAWSQDIQDNKRDSVYQDLSQSFLKELGDTTDIVTTNVSSTSNWFVSFAGGATSLQAEANRLYDSFFERMHPAFQVSVGKWINPVFGLRLHTGFGGLSGHYYPFFFYNLFYKLHDHTIMPPAAKPFLSKDGQWFHRKFNYFEFSLNIMTDVVRWFRNRNSRWGVYLMAGPGMAHSFENQGILSNNSFAFKGALQVNYRLGKQWDVFAEVHGTIVDESFDGQIGGYDGKVNRTLEGFGGLSIGVSYRLGEKKFQRYVRMNPIVHESVLRTYTHTVTRYTDKTPIKKIAPLMVRFYIDQYNVEPDQRLGIYRVSHYMKTHPETKVRLSGYADKETAYPAYNLRLSKRRCNSVRTFLIEECGIDPSRIIMDPKGDMMKVYIRDSRWNRLVVMEILE